MNNLLNDIRGSLRTLTRNPGFTFSVILVLALGIAGNTTVFSILNAFLLRPLPFEQPEELVHIWSTDQAKGWTENRVSLLDLQDYRVQSTTLADVGPGLRTWLGFDESAA